MIWVLLYMVCGILTGVSLMKAWYHRDNPEVHEVPWYGVLIVVWFTVCLWPAFWLWFVHDMYFSKK